MTARHLFFRLEDGALPEALQAKLRDEVVLAGWFSGSGILADVVLRTHDGHGFGAPRRIAGPIHALFLDGSLALANGDVSCALRTTLSREGDAGNQTLSGEIVEARVVALEVFVTAVDDVSVTRADVAGVALLKPTAEPTATAPSAPKTPPPARVVAPPPAPAPPRVERAASPGEPAPRAAENRADNKPVGFVPTAMPARIAKPAQTFEEDQVYPETGDIVEHFAFGRCEVVKGDGDRLHLRVGKEQRVKEIALEMLRVTPLPPEEGQTTKHYRLDRRL